MIDVSAHLTVVAVAGGGSSCRSARRFAGFARIVLAFNAAVALEGAAGIVNLLLLAPVWMQMVHLLFVYLLWIALVALCWRPTKADR